MGNERYNAPAPHERTLPHVPVNEQGLRELEIWLLARLRKLLLQQVRGGGGGEGLQYHRGTYGADNEGDWFFAAANDTTGAPSIGYEDGAGNVYTFGFAWQFDTGNSGAPFAITNDGGFLIDTAGSARINATSDMTVHTSDASFHIGQQFYVFLADGSSTTIYNSDLDPLLDITEAGQINLYPKTPSGMTIDDTGPFTLSADDDIEFSIDTSGKTLTIKDHLGSPLVTYTG